MPFPRRLRHSFPQFRRGHHHNHISCRYTHPHIFNSVYPYTSTSSFSTTSYSFYASTCEPNYYEVLDVPVTATPAEIKKQFYSLSLSHHPDRNRDDPTASARFARISCAYHVLSNAAKRATYDRDHGIHAAHHQPFSSTHSSAQPGQHPMGSYSSHSQKGGPSYYGSRPASGLSKRKGPFRGPPPSFYAHGGYGKNTGRKPPPHPTGTGTSASKASSSSSSSSSSAGAAGSSGARGGEGDDPTSFIDRNPVSHFNARGHYRTQSAEDTRRAERRSREMSASINDQYLGGRGDFALRFIVVCGILVGAGALGGFFRWPNSERSNRAIKASRQKDD